MHTESERAVVRWVLAIGFVSLSITTAWILQAILPLSPSATAATGHPIGSPDGPAFIGFTDDPADPSRFIDALVLEDDGADHQVYLSAAGMSVGAHDTLQVLLNHDSSIIEITDTACVGLFDGAFSGPGPVDISPGQTAFMCGMEGGVSQETGIVMRLGIKRLAPGSALIEISTDGDFGTRVFAAGNGSTMEPVGSLSVREPDPTPTPTALPTATATTPPPPSGPVGGGGSSQPAPSPTPSVSVPGIPTSLVVVPGDGEVTLSWSAPTNDGGTPINQYLVRSADGQINRQFSASGNPVLITGLVNGREYSFRVRAINAVGQGPFSSFSEPVVPAGPPSVPESLSAKFIASSAEVTLVWTAPTDANGAEIEAYEVREATGLLEPRTLGPDALSQTYTDLLPGEYRFLVAATNRAGTGVAAEIVVTVPPVLQQPVEPTPDNPVIEPETGQSGLSEVPQTAVQLRNAIGVGVVLTDDLLLVDPQEEMLRFALPVKIDPATQGDTGTGDFTGFSIDALTVDSENGRPSRGTFALGEGAEISGEVTLLTDARGVSAEMRNLRLRLAPVFPLSGPAKSPLAQSPIFETSLVSVVDVPALTVRELAVIGPPELPTAPALEALLLAHGWAVPELSAQTQPSAWKVEHAAGSFMAGDTVFSFTTTRWSGNDSLLVVIKQDDNGVVYARQADCEQVDSGLARCSALFEGEAGGFSAFAVLEVDTVEEKPGADSVLGSAASEGVKASPSPQVTATASPAPTPTSLVQPTISATTKTAVSADTFTLPENENSNPQSVVAIVALASVGFVVVAGLGGYVVVHLRGGHTTDLTILAIPVAAAAVLLIATYPDRQSALASGTVVSQGDAAQQSDDVRSSFGVDGTGITVGIISDSVNCTGGIAADIEAGELPADFDMSDDAPSIFCGATTDRGRAMAQVVHDVAPGAEIIFSSALTGKTDMVVKIEALVGMGADIIVDDRLFADQLIFQDDVVAQAVDQASAAGVVYITSAGDPGIASYESQFVSVEGIICGSSGGCTEPGKWHDFDPGPGVDRLLDVSLTDPVVNMMLQWDQPSALGGGAGSESDMELYVFDDKDNLIRKTNGTNIFSGHPGEGLGLEGKDSVQIAISHKQGIEPDMVKLVILNGAVINEFATDSSSIVGHRNAAGAITVGPVNYANTAAFDGVPEVESSAPVGGTEILFNGNGDALVTPVVRQKPDIVAPSGVGTTLGPLDGSPAAAAHVAGAVALLLELRSDLHSSGQLGPETVRYVLSQTSIDVVPAGPDLQSGSGLIDVMAAASMLITEPPVAFDDAYSVKTGEVFTVGAPGVLENDTDKDIPALVARLVSGPVNGDLELQADGSFSYTAASDFAGVDSFTYLADNGDFTSVPATVSITVTGSEGLVSAVSLQGVDDLANFGTETIYIVLTKGSSVYEAELVPGGPPSFLFSGLAPGTYGLAAYAPGFLIAARQVVLGTVPGETVTVGSVELRAGDVNSDDLIDSVDAEILALAFGTQHAPGERRSATGDIVDLNGDGVTNGTDASLAISNIGLAKPMPWLN